MRCTGRIITSCAMKFCSSFLALYLLILASPLPLVDSRVYIEVYPNPTDPHILRGRTPLYIALIQNLGGDGSMFNGLGSVAGVKVALDWINNDTTLLPGYTLHYTLTDSKVIDQHYIDPTVHTALSNLSTT